MGRPGGLPPARPGPAPRPASSRRFPDAPRFVPEVLRTPVYPPFRRASSTRCSARTSCRVALAQTALFVVICLLVFAIARRVDVGPGRARRGARDGALPADPVFRRAGHDGSLDDASLHASMWLALSARSMSRDSAPFVPGSAFCSALTTLSRPVVRAVSRSRSPASAWSFLPLLRVRAADPPRAVVRRCSRRSPSTMLPWFVVQLRDARPVHAVAGRRRRPRDCGKARGRPRGRAALQNELTHLADDIDDRAELDRQRRRRRRRANSCRPAPMLEYVHQWQDIRLIWTTPTDPYERAIARVAGRPRIPARRRCDNIRRDRLAHPRPNGSRGACSSCGPAKSRSATATSTRCRRCVIRVCWADAGGPAVAVALVGAAALFRAVASAEACLLGAPIALRHGGSLSAAHRSAPVAAGAARAAGPRDARRRVLGWPPTLLALEPQVHERQHL